MSPEELRRLLVREPFQPFRVRLTDGRSFDIQHPGLHLVAESVFIIGIPAPDDPEPQFFDHTVWVPLKLIAGIDLLPEPAAPTLS